MYHYTHFTTEERELSRVLKAQGLSIDLVLMLRKAFTPYL